MLHSSFDYLTKFRRRDTTMVICCKNFFHFLEKHFLKQKPRITGFAACLSGNDHSLSKSPFPSIHAHLRKIKIFGPWRYQDQCRVLSACFRATVTISGVCKSVNIYSVTSNARIPLSMAKKSGTLVCMPRKSDSRKAIGGMKGVEAQENSAGA